MKLLVKLLGVICFLAYSVSSFIFCANSARQKKMTLSAISHSSSALKHTSQVLTPLVLISRQ